MAKTSRNFIAGRMNQIVDERLLPDGEYIYGMNIRMGDTEKSEVGVIENTKGNLSLTNLSFEYQLSINAKCIGAIEDSKSNTLYWFVHDAQFPAYSGVCDMILSYNVYSDLLTYHVISIDDGTGNNTSTLNFNEQYLITGVNIIGDLLFFTDDYNPPRVINVNRNYANPIGGIDQIYAEELLVIKKPPTESPTVQPIVTSGQENYMDTRFISFAYRYRYIDGEYSATSQWSQISFVPNPFSFSINSMLNEGMTNACNTAIITYNSGGPLVVGVDLLFKQSANNVIKVIEKLDKANLGLANDTDYTYTFSNSKIFTVLSESEILRLYDNVPRFAKAQTIMGNRLMYGNYVEGYDLIDKDNYPIKLEYYTTLISEAIGQTNIPDSLGNGNYNVDLSQTIADSVLYIDLDGKNLVEGSAITIQMTFAHATFSGDTPFPAETTDNISIDFSFYLPTNYASVYDLATSTEFQNAVGTVTNIKPVFSSIPGTETSCDGITFTDLMNCVIPNNLDALIKYQSGVSSLNTAIQIVASPSSSFIGFQLIAMRYVNNTTTPTQNVYEYYAVTYADATFQEISNPQSLHSNRGYEIGIVYMDEFNRSTTALVSPNNTEHVPCGFSPKKNGIQVTIPSTQVAPLWAKRYKFVIKPDAENYEIIYSNLFIEDPSTNEVWFNLEGENTKKVEVGDRLIVKSDSSGPVLNCAYATVLAKEAKAANFITPVTGTVPAGVYMKINPNSFNAVSNPDAHIYFGSNTACAPKGGNYSHLRYLVAKYEGAGYDITHPLWEYSDYTIPAGSRIKLVLLAERSGIGNSCERKGYYLEKYYVSSNDYDNIEDWFNGDNVSETLNTGTSFDNNTSIEYIPTNGYLTAVDFDKIYLQFYRDPTTNELTLQSSTGKSCTGVGYSNSRQYCVTLQVELWRAIDTIVFETEPSDALPDVFYENNLSFEIDDNGNHMGNIQDQDISLGRPAIVDTKFFNCFSFGNGVESYKIRDSLIGRYFTLGERVTTVSAQEYKEADRFADITYSGVYNAETNVNKLNEFNLGLLDYKNLETSFGDIYILDGRETDVLVLQEDKISYVLAGKNLLSDSAAGGAITSVPEVLGTQIARTEKYGISFNPESYVQWGFNRYFTDAKRGVVIQLVGDSYSNEQIKVISDENMRTWFRDEFNASFNTQKLGGFDPYMNEYVLSGNDTKLPMNVECLDCGITQTFNLTLPKDAESATYTYCVNLGNFVGLSDVVWVVGSTICDFSIEVFYGGESVYSSGTVSESGEGSFDKDSVANKIATVVISYSCENLNIGLTIGCPQAEPMTIVEMVLTNNVDEGDTIHTEYRYVDGTYTGPLQSSYVTFINSATAPTVSRYNVISGTTGGGAFPPAGTSMMIRTNQIPPDTFVFSPGYNKFKYLRDTVLYPNTPTGINTVLSLSTDATPIITGDTTNTSNFTVPSQSLGQYLYLIWDLRVSSPSLLCYSEMDSIDPRRDVCCSCSICASDCVVVRIANQTNRGTAEVYFPNGQTGCGGPSGPLSVMLNAAETVDICLANDFDGLGMWQVISGVVEISIIECGCSACEETCSQWYYINDGNSKAFVSFEQCGACGDTKEFEVLENTVKYLDVCRDTTPTVTGGSTSNLVMTKYCGVCPLPVGEYPYCITFEVYDITASMTVNYTDCNDSSQSFTVNPGDAPVQICVLYPYIPILEDKTKAKIRIVGEGCNCAPS